MAGASLPAAAEAAWTQPQGLSAIGAGAPQIAVHANGKAVGAWTIARGDGRYAFEYRLLAAGGTMGPRRTVAGDVGSAGDIGVDAARNTVFAWSRASDLRVQTRRRAPDGTLGQVRTLSVGGGLQPEVAVGPAGDCAFVWLHDDGSTVRVQGRLQDADGTLSAIRTFSGRGSSALRTHVGIDSSGNAVFVWSRDRGRAQARGWTADGDLGPIQNVSPPRRRGNDVQVAVDPDGRAVIAWQTAVNSHRRVQARARQASGALGHVMTLSGGTQDAFRPAVDIDSTGDATLAWEFGASWSPQNQRIQVRTLTAGGGLTPVQTVSPPGGTDLPEVAVGDNGDGVIAWMRGQGAPTSQIEARTRAAAGKLGPVRTLSTSRRAVQLEVAMDPAGEAAATWLGGGGFVNRAVAALGP